MRALIFELRPESLAQEGLIAALHKQAAALQARHGLRVDAQLDEEPDASLATKDVVYRIAREALHNAVKHARANSVQLLVKSLLVKSEDKSLIVVVRDEGVGFEVADEFPGHLGLRSMRERATGAAGVLEVDSVPGAGTRVRAAIPI